MIDLYPDSFSVRPLKAERPPRGNPRCVTVPKAATPIVRFVFGELSRQRLRYVDIEMTSGVKTPAIKQWRRRSRPSWESLQSVLATLGFGFVPTPALQVLPPELAGEVTALAMKLGRDIPQTWAALIDIGVEQRLIQTDANERRAVVEAHRAALRGHNHRRKPSNDNTPRHRHRSVA